MAAGFAASSAPNSRPEPELLAADRYQGAEQTMDLIWVPGNTPCQLRPQPNGPSLSLTVLYLKGHCRFASLPCSEQYIYIVTYIFAIEEAGEEGKGGGKLGEPGITGCSEMPDLISCEGMKAEDSTQQRTRDFNCCIWAEQEAD